MKRVTRFVLLTALALVMVTSSVWAGGKVTILGSDTLLEMVSAEAEAFMKKNPGDAIQVSGGGSGTGIASLINGSIDIADASRPMKKKERKKIEKGGGSVYEVAVALDGITVYLNPCNPVNGLNMGQLKDIYTGKVNNWKEVGGNDAQIIRYGRENNSGTYALVKKLVLHKENYANDTQSLPGTASVVNAVSKDKNALGYGGISYAEGVKIMAVNGVKPSPETIGNSSYPISRKLFQYSIGVPKGLANTFIQYELSPEGQKLAVKAGYVPLSENMRLESLKSLK